MHLRYFLLLVLFFSSKFLSAQVDTLKLDSLTANVPSAAQNRLSGSENTTPFGSEGMGMGVRITGTSILNISSNPLIVVDGIPYQNVSSESFDFTTADERDYAALIGIAQEDIKEIAIVQDAASAAQYGPRAVGGVILITTQRGTKGKTHVNYSYKNTLGYEPMGYDVLNGDEYSSLIPEGYMNSSGASLDWLSYPEFKNDPSNPYYFYNYTKNTDWTKAITQMGLSHNHNLSVSGGTNKLGYRLSAGYITNEGTIKGTGQKRNTARLVLDYKFTNRLKAFFTLDYLQASTENSYQGNGYLPIRELALKKMPNASIYEMDEHGNYTGEYLLPTGGGIQGSNYINPLAMVDLSSNNRKNNRIIPSFSLSYNPIEQISYLFNASYTSEKVSGGTFFSNKLYGSIFQMNDVNTSFENEYQYFYTLNQFRYTPFNNSRNSLTAVASFNTYSRKIDGSNFGQISNDSKYKSHYEILRLNYLAFNKYSIDVCGRGEKEHDVVDYFNYTSDYNIYPAVTLQWFASREGFMKALTIINNLSFKASYGVYGNLIFDSWYINFGSISGSFITEKTYNKDIGVNLTFLNNRLDVNLNYYSRKVCNQAPWDIENKGWELNIQTTLIKSKDFSMVFAMDVYKNLQFINNVSSLISILSRSEYYDINNGLLNGVYIRYLDLNKTVGSVSGFRSQGVYIDDADATARDINGNTINDINGIPLPMKFNFPNVNYSFQGGDAKYADLNYDGNINASDITTIGNVNPKFTGSISPSFRYKGLWLGIYFNFRYGNDIVNLARMDLEQMCNFDNQSTAVLRRWRIPGDVTDIPRALIGIGNNNLGSDRFVENGSFLRLKAITLKYEFGNAIVNRLHLNNLRCFITCRNLFTLTDYQGADADIMLNKSWDQLGYDNNYTAPTKEFTFGINVGI